MKKRFVNEYDMIRIIATMLVVIGHSAYLKVSTNWGGVDYNWLAELFVKPGNLLGDLSQSLSVYVYRFHMPLFFVLSGAVFGIGIKKYKSIFVNSFLINKAKRLLVPYFTYGMGYMFSVKYLTGFYNKGGYAKL